MGRPMFIKGSSLKEETIKIKIKGKKLTGLMT
jgi:hypothetical protein